MVKLITQDTLGPLLLRLGLAALFILHGRDTIAADADWANKVTHLSAASRDFVLACGQLVVGIVLAAGFLTRLAAFGGAAITVVLSRAIPFDFETKGLSLLTGENGYNIVTFCACVVLVLTGGGNISLDRAIRRWRKGY